MATASIDNKPSYVPDLLARSRVKLTGLSFLLVLSTEFFLGQKPRNPLDGADPWVACGSIAIVAGLLIRSWAAGTLVKKEKLACDGPYALVRHPLYAGSILMMLGFTLLSGMWWNCLLAAVVAGFSIGHAIRSEETFLATKFGDSWSAYAAQAGRLLPRRVAGNPVTRWSYVRWLTNREFNAWLGTLIGWTALWLWWRA